MENKKRIGKCLKSGGADGVVFLVSVYPDSLPAQGTEYTGRDMPGGRPEYLREILEHFFEGEGKVSQMGPWKDAVTVRGRWNKARCRRYGRCLKDSVECLLELKGVKGVCRVEVVRGE